jgi:CelD/BcsL family acetyltransferase involved in cellulose biosynthesis
MQPIKELNIFMSSTGSFSDKEVTCSVYSSFEKISDLQSHWDAFVEQVSGDIFLTFDWCRIWWQYYGKERNLCVFIFKNSDQNIVGIIPMFFETIWACFIPVRIGKIVGCDFTLAQFTLPLHPDYLDSCIKLFLETLKSMQWHILNIGPLAGLCANTEALKDALCRFSSDSEKVAIRDGMVQTYFKLESTWEKHLASLNKNQRREIVRKYAALEKKVPNIAANLKTIFADTENLDSIFSAFVDMHQKHWQGIGKRGHFGDWPNAFEFHHDAAKAQLQRGRLRLMSIQIDSDILGYEYAYKFGAKYFAFLNARTEEQVYGEIGIGTIDFSEQVKRAISEKVDCIDAMRGRYEYKLRLGGELFATKKISVIRKGLINAFRVKTLLVAAALLNIIYYKIWFHRIAPRLPFKRNPIRKFWIRLQL